MASSPSPPHASPYYRTNPSRSLVQKVRGPTPFSLPPCPAQQACTSLLQVSALAAFRRTQKRPDDTMPFPEYDRAGAAIDPAQAAISPTFATSRAEPRLTTLISSRITRPSTLRPPLAAADASLSRPPLSHSHEMQPLVSSTSSSAAAAAAAAAIASSRNITQQPRDDVELMPGVRQQQQPSSSSNQADAKAFASALRCRLPVLPPKC